MKKKHLLKRLKAKKRQMRELEWKLSEPTKMSMILRGQLVVIDFPEYPGAGKSFHFRELVLRGMAKVRGGELPVGYAESCKDELIECLAIVEAAMAKLQNAEPSRPRESATEQAPADHRSA